MAWFGAKAIYLILLAYNPLMLVFSLHTHDDEFKVLAQSWAMAQGSRLYLDLWDYLPPVSFWLLASVFKLTGPSLEVARLMAALVALGIGYLSHRLAKALGAGPWASLFALAGVSLGCLPFWKAWYPHWLAWLWVLLGLILGARLLRESPESHATHWTLGALAAGACMAIAGLSSQSSGAVGAVGLGMAWLGACLGGHWTRLWAWRSAWALGAGLAAPLVSATAWYAMDGGVRDFWRAVAWWPATHYRQPGNLNDLPPFTDFEGLFPRWRQAMAYPLWLARGGAWLVASLAPFGAALLALAGLVVGGLAWLRQGWKPGPQALAWGMVAASAVVSAYFAYTGRGDVTHLAIAGVLAWVLVAPLLSRALENRPLPTPSGGAPEGHLARMAMAHAPGALAILCLLPLATNEVASARHLAMEHRLVWRQDEVYRNSELVQAVRKHLPPQGRLFFFPYGGVPFLYTPAIQATRFGVLTPLWQNFMGPEEHVAFEAEQRKRGLPELIAIGENYASSAVADWGGSPTLAPYRLVAQPGPLPGGSFGYLLYALKATASPGPKPRATTPSTLPMAEPSP